MAKCSGKLGKQLTPTTASGMSEEAFVMIVGASVGRAVMFMLALTFPTIVFHD